MVTSKHTLYAADGGNGPGGGGPGGGGPGGKPGGGGPGGGGPGGKPGGRRRKKGPATGPAHVCFLGMNQMPDEYLMAMSCS